MQSFPGVITSLQTQGAKYRFSGFIQTNKQTNKRRLKHGSESPSLCTHTHTCAATPRTAHTHQQAQHPTHERWWFHIVKIVVSLALSLSHTQTHTPSLTHTGAHDETREPLWIVLSLPRTLFLSGSLAHARALSFTISLSPTHTYTHTGAGQNGDTSHIYGCT